MIVSIISLAYFRNSYIRKSNFGDFKDSDMYRERNLNNTLCDLNNYLYINNKSVEDIKRDGLLINEKIKLSFDELKDKFFVEYKYKGLVYEKAVRLIKNDKGTFFVPDEKKYISD